MLRVMAIRQAVREALVLVRELLVRVLVRELLVAYGLKLLMWRGLKLMAIRQADSYESCRQVSPGVAQARIFRGAARCGPLQTPPRVSAPLSAARSPLQDDARCQVWPPGRCQVWPPGRCQVWPPGRCQVWPPGGDTCSWRPHLAPAPLRGVKPRGPLNQDAEVPGVASSR
jgi:hypothetical protein